MRIAFVSTIFAYPWGGADALWTCAAENAVQRGDQVLIAIGPDTAKHARIEELRKSGARILIRQPKPASGGRLSALRDFKWRVTGGTDLHAAFTEWKPERIIVSQGGHVDYIQDHEALDWAEKARVPFEIICQANSDWFSVPSENFEAAKKRAAEARRFWFVSEQNREIAETQFAMKLPNAKVIQNPLGIADAKFLPWPSSPPWSLAVVARFDAVCKGLDLLFSVLPDVLGSESDWTISLFGRGRDEVYLRELAKFTGMENRIQFCGYANDVKAIWERQHLLLLPSRLEGCALAMLEAMACGRPVLATMVGGAAEWIRNDRDGFLCPAATKEALAATLAHAWKMRGEWKRLGESAAQRFQSMRDPNPGKTLLEDFA